MMGLSFMAIGIVLTIIFLVYFEVKKDDDFKGNVQHALSVGIVPFGIGIHMICVQFETEFKILGILGFIVLLSSCGYLIYFLYVKK